MSNFNNEFKLCQHLAMGQVYYFSDCSTPPSTIFFFLFMVILVYYNLPDVLECQNRHFWLIFFFFSLKHDEIRSLLEKKIVVTPMHRFAGRITIIVSLNTSLSIRQLQFYANMISKKGSSMVRIF